MAFCPKCKSEFKAGIVECADCNVPLIGALSMDEIIDFTELYACNTILEAEHLKIILKERNIDCNLRLIECSSFPLSAGVTSETRLVVPMNYVATARQIIQECIENHEISDKGLFIE